MTDYWISGYDTTTTTAQDLVEDFLDTRADRLVVNYSFEWQPYPNFDALYDLCVHQGIALTIIMGSTEQLRLFLEERYPKAEIIFWPSYWIFFAFCCQRSQEFLLSQRPRTNGEATYRFLCMGGQPHLHRCIIIDEMWRRGLQHKGKIGWPAGGSIHKTRVNPLPDGWEFKHFPNHQMLLDDNWTLGSRSAFKLPPELDLASLNVITESQGTRIFVTEKTVTSSLRKKPWIMIGGPGQNQLMRDMGFAMLDQLIDYTYDLDADLVTRCNLFIDQVESWIDRPDWSTIEQSSYIKDIVAHNHDQVYRVIQERIMFPQIVHDLLDSETFTSSESKFISVINSIKL